MRPTVNPWRGYFAVSYFLHDAADAGKIAHYLLRWVNTRSESGPWSETVSATITG